MAKDKLTEKRLKCANEVMQHLEECEKILNRNIKKGVCKPECVIKKSIGMVSEIVDVQIKDIKGEKY